jgi:hypothetical protein
MRIPGFTGFPDHWMQGSGKGSRKAVAMSRQVTAWIMQRESRRSHARLMSMSTGTAPG